MEEEEAAPCRTRRRAHSESRAEQSRAMRVRDIHHSPGQAPNKYQRSGSGRPWRQAQSTGASARGEGSGGIVSRPGGGRRRRAKRYLS